MKTHHSSRMRVQAAPRVEPLEERLLLSIIGRDDRVRVTNTRAFPWSAVCQLQSTFPDGYRGLGSGAVIGSRYVLTAGHVVYDSSHGGWASKVQVAAGRNGSSLPFG